MTETWKTIEGYPNYEVSNTGRVISHARTHDKELRQMEQRGYLVVGLCRENIVKRILVHRLVAQAFCDNPHNKSQVNHIDGNRKNNSAENLEWVTPKENSCHARDTLGFDFKSANGMQKQIVRSDGVVFPSINEASRATGCTRGNIQHVLRGTRKHSGGYGWCYA